MQRHDARLSGRFEADQVTNTAQYVLPLSGRSTATTAAARGDTTFQQLFSACHGAGGKGMVALGAPNLTDSIWLYGGSLATVVESTRKGRLGKMPAQKDLLGESRVHLLAVYVYAQTKEQSQTTSRSRVANVKPDPDNQDSDEQCCRRDESHFAFSVAEKDLCEVDHGSLCQLSRGYSAVHTGAVLRACLVAVERATGGAV